MPKYPFKHDGHVYLISADDYEVAYYVRNGKKYKRERYPFLLPWEKTTEQGVGNDTFAMTAACIERGSKHA